MSTSNTIKKPEDLNKADIIEIISESPNNYFCTVGVSRDRFEQIMGTSNQCYEQTVNYLKLKYSGDPKVFNRKVNSAITWLLCNWDIPENLTKLMDDLDKKAYVSPTSVFVYDNNTPSDEIKAP